MTYVANDIFDHHYGAIYDHAEIEGAQGQEVRRYPPEVQTARGEEQGKRNGQGHNEGAPDASEEKEEDDSDENEPFREIMEDRVGRVMDELAPVVEGDDLHALGQDLFVQLLHLFLDAPDRFIKRGAFAHEHDA